MVQIRDDHIRFISELARYSNSEVSSLGLLGRGPVWALGEKGQGAARKETVIGIMESRSEGRIHIGGRGTGWPRAEQGLILVPLGPSKLIQHLCAFVTSSDK